MSQQARRETRPELSLRRELFRQGLRYRIQWPVPGSPRRKIDIAFPGLRVAVLVDGCFWHGCPAHATWPRANAAWWRAKIECNRRRDVETTQLLTTAGWVVVRVWEHEAPEVAAERVFDVVARRRAVA